MESDRFDALFHVDSFEGGPAAYRTPSTSVRVVAPHRGRDGAVVSMIAAVESVRRTGDVGGRPVLAEFAFRLDVGHLE